MPHSNYPTQTCIRRLQKEYKDLVKEPIENIKIYVSPSNLLEWYYCIYDLDDDVYQGGEYYGLIEMSPDYPLEPPSYYMYTPNGRFVPDEPICMSNSSYHPETWQPTWTMDAIFRGFLSFFLEDNSQGQINLNHMRVTDAAKKAYAQKSHEYNQKYYESLHHVFQTNEGVIYVPPKPLPEINKEILPEINKETEVPVPNANVISSTGKIKIRLKVKNP